MLSQKVLVILTITYLKVVQSLKIDYIDDGQTRYFFLFDLPLRNGSLKIDIVTFF